jgi:hypothetical protein
MVQDGLSRAQHYRDLAAQMQKAADEEPDSIRKKELLDLVRQYQRLVKEILDNH